MTTPAITDTQRDAKPPRDGRLSPDGKWRSFPKVPNSVQYVNTGTYFGRVKIEGKIFRESLQADVFTTFRSCRILYGNRLVRLSPALPGQVFLCPRDKPKRSGAEAAQRRAQH